MEGIKPHPEAGLDDIESVYGSKDGGDVAIHTETFAIKREALGKFPMQISYAIIKTLISLRTGTDLPPHYWRSPGFIGTVAALCFGNISNYTSWVMPSNSLDLINKSIGPSELSHVLPAFEQS